MQEHNDTNPTNPSEQCLDRHPAGSYDKLGETAFAAPDVKSLPDARGRVVDAVKNIYGYTIVGLGAISIGLEQSPANENLRIHEGLETLVATGNPAAVGRRVAMVTVPIEAIPAAFIIAAVHSSNPIVVKPRARLNEWKDGGDKRVEYRAEKRAQVKQDRFDHKNLKRIEKGKGPKKLEDTLSYKLSKAGEWVNDRIPDRLGSELTDLGLALGLGAGIVVLKESFLRRGTQVRDSIYTAIKAIAEISIVSGLIGYFVAGGTQKAKVGIPLTDHTLHFEEQAQLLIDYGTDTKALMALLLIAYTPSTLAKLWHRLPKQEAKFQKWLTENK